MGADLTVDDERREGGEDVGTVLAAPGAALRGTEVDAAEVPSMIDELPLLACVAALRRGRDRGARRGRAAREGERPHRGRGRNGLRAVGADADELPDGFVVRGRGPRRSPGAS
jgi:3-phosphoshikimate 1-carboxyvinyltransferase